MYIYIYSVHRRMCVGRIYNSIAQNVKLSWSIQVTSKRRAIGKSD